MKWNRMEDAPRDGSPVVLLFDDFSGVVAARFGMSDEGGASGWFYLDYTDTLGETCDGIFTDYSLTDSGFAGWTAIPEPSKEAVPSGASRHSAEHDRRETTSNDEQRD